MENFEFHRPGSAAEAVAACAEKDEAKFLGGGQSLLPLMKLDLAAPSDLIDLSGIDGLKEIRTEGDALVVGAMATHAEVHASPAVRDAIPSLAELAGHIGDAQVRNAGTLGGSLAHADPAADYPAALVALNGTVITDRREIAADDFFTGMFSSALAEDELITAVRFPIPEAAAYAKFPNPASKYAVVGVMVAKTGGGVRVGVTGASSHAHRFGAMEEALSADFSTTAVDGVPAPSEGLTDDADASAGYRAHLLKVMTKRAVEAAS